MPFPACTGSPEAQPERALPAHSPGFMRSDPQDAESENEVPQEGTYLITGRMRQVAAKRCVQCQGSGQESFIGNLIDLALVFGQDAPPHRKA